MTYSDSLLDSFKKAGNLDIFDADGKLSKLSFRWVRLVRQDSRSPVAYASRFGEFVLLDKNAPAFKGKVFVKRDESPGEDYISVGDLALYVKEVKEPVLKAKKRKKNKED